MRTWKMPVEKVTSEKISDEELARLVRAELAADPPKSYKDTMLEWSEKICTQPEGNALGVGDISC